MGTLTSNTSGTRLAAVNAYEKDFRARQQLAGDIPGPSRRHSLKETLLVRNVSFDSELLSRSEVLFTRVDGRDARVDGRDVKFKDKLSCKRYYRLLLQLQVASCKLHVERARIWLMHKSQPVKSFLSANPSLSEPPVRALPAQGRCPVTRRTAQRRIC